MIERTLRYETNMEDLPQIVKNIARTKSVQAIYLFGSQVTGNSHALSDIDLCIFLDNEEHESEVEYSGTDNLDITFFHRLPLTIQYRVLKEGRPLVVKDKNLVHDLKIKTLRSYIEFKPAILRFIKETLQCTM